MKKEVTITIAFGLAFGNPPHRILKLCTAEKLTLLEGKIYL